MSNQTFKNESNKRGENIKNEAISLLRPLWLGMRDSNPRSRDQNPLPYRLANPQYWLHRVELYSRTPKTSSRAYHLQYAAQATSIRFNNQR